MSKRPDDLEVPERSEFSRVWDERFSEWVEAWLSHWRRQRVVNFMSSVVFDDSTTSKNSDPFFCAPYRQLQLFVDLSVTSTPTDIQIFEQFSFNGVKWFNHTHTPWGSLVYEDSAGDKLESIHSRIVAPWLRFRAVATGTDATNKFTLSLDCVFDS